MLKRRSHFGNLHFLPSREALGFLRMTTPVTKVFQPFYSIKHTTLSGFFKVSYAYAVGADSKRDLREYGRGMPQRQSVAQIAFRGTA